MRLLIFIVFLGIGTTLPGCQTLRDSERIDIPLTGADVQRGLDRCDHTDGIHRMEALSLASAYFAKHKGSCGGLWSIGQARGYWIIETVEGYDGVAGEPIKIDTTAGTVSSKGSPSSSPPWQDLKTWFAGMLKAVNS